jgi:hypothetical protein
MGKDTTPVGHEAEAPSEAEQAIGAQAGDLIQQIVTLMRADPGFQVAEGAEDFFSSTLGPQWGAKRITNVIFEGGDGFRYDLEYRPGGSPERPGTSLRKEKLKVLRFDPARSRPSVADVVIELETHYEARYVQNPFTTFTNRMIEVARSYKTGSIVVDDRTGSEQVVHRNSPDALHRIPEVLPILPPSRPQPIRRPAGGK